MTEDAHALSRTPENAQSKAVLKRHYKAHVKPDTNRTHDENNIVNYFTHCYVAGNRKAGTFWCVRSCVKSFLLTSIKIDISEHKLLRKLIVSTTKKHIAEKADTFDSDEFQLAMEEAHDEEDPKELIDKVSSLCSHYGTHRHSEVSQIDAQDAVLGNSEDVDAIFSHPTKRHAEGFSCKMPGSTKSTLMKCISQLAPKLD